MRAKSKGVLLSLGSTLAIANSTFAAFDYPHSQNIDAVDVYHGVSVNDSYAGHGHGKSRAKLIDEATDKWAFLTNVLHADQSNVASK
jgi:hypothetical protein